MAETVERWAPTFLQYEGTKSTKFTKEQILDPKFALSRYSDHGEERTWCKLCDAPVGDEGNSAHMRDHDRELSAWLKRRRRESEKRSLEGLKTYREEQELAAKISAAAIIKEELS